MNKTNSRTLEQLKKRFINLCCDGKCVNVKMTDDINLKCVIFWDEDVESFMKIHSVTCSKKTKSNNIICSLLSNSLYEDCIFDFAFSKLKQEIKAYNDKINKFMKDSDDFYNRCTASNEIFFDNYDEWWNKTFLSLL